MLNCDEALARVSLALDDELDDAERGTLSRHLASCQGCRLAATQIREIDALFRSAPMKYAPIGFTERAVAAAFEADFRRNLWIGLLTLLLGTILVGGLFLSGHIDLFLSAVATLISPGFSGTALLAQLTQGLEVVGRVGWVLLSVLRGMLVGPLLIPALLSLMAAGLVIVALRRTGQGMVMSIL